jgi:hypothetical protein
LVLLVACVRASVTPLTTETYPPVPVDSVTVLADISELQADSIEYVRVAVINMKGSASGLTDAEDMLRKAREEAAALGANAIIMAGFTQGTYNMATGMGSLNEGSAIAVRYWIVKP